MKDKFKEGDVLIITGNGDGVEVTEHFLPIGSEVTVISDSKDKYNDYYVSGEDEEGALCQSINKNHLKLKTNIMNKEEAIKRLDEISSEIKDIKKALEEKVEFVKGKWYIDDDGDMCCYQKNIHGPLYSFLSGYGVASLLGGWFDEIAISVSSARLMTDKEVEEVLVREAKKRGFCKDGVVFNCAHELTTRLGCVLEYNEMWQYHSGKNTLSMNCNQYFFHNGKWATIIKEVPEYTMEEIIERVGHEFKIKK